MRVTNNMMARTVLRNIGANAANINKIQDQMSTGYRITRLSDDPLGMVTSLNSRTKVYAMAQHISNLDQADAWLTAAETGVMEMNNIITTMYQDTMDAATDAKTAADRVAIAQKVREFRDQLINNANSTITDKTVYGAYNGTKGPFEEKYGSLYYNGFHMYAYPAYAADGGVGTLNAEQFINGGVQALYAQLGGVVGNSTDVVDAATSLQTAMETVIGAARTIYNTRKVSDEDNGNNLVTPSAKHMIGAMEDVIAANSAAWSPEQLAMAQAMLDGAQAAQDTYLREFNDSAPLDLLMKGLEQTSIEVGAAVKELAERNNRGEFAGSAAAIQFIADRADVAQSDADRAVEAATDGMGIDYEAAKRYEIEVGYGQLMDITINGVSLFGRGENNLYKVLDDLYNALTREYTDISYGTDAYISEAMDALKGISDASAAGTVADYLAEMGLAASAVSDIALYGLGLLKGDSSNSVGYGAQAQMDVMMSYLYGSTALDAAASEAAYAANFQARASAFASVAQAGIVAIRVPGRQIADVVVAMNAAVAADAAAAADPELANALGRMIHNVQMGLDTGMTDSEAILGLGRTIDKADEVNDRVQAEAASGLFSLGEIKDNVAREYRETRAELEAFMTTVGGDGGIASSELTTRMRDQVRDSWPQDVKEACYDVIAKLERGMTVGISREELAATLQSLSSAMNDVNADLAASGAATVADAQAVVDEGQVQARAAYMTSQSGLKSGSIASDITPFVGKMQEKQKDMMSQLAIIGGRCNRIDILQERYSLDELNYTTRISKIEDVDMASAMMQYKMAYSVYTSALQAGANVIQPTLMDYMR